MKLKFGQIFECQKYNILVITWALVLSLICMPSALGPAALGLLAYIHIRQSTRAHVITYTYTHKNLNGE